MRRMITGKQQEFVEELGEKINVAPGIVSIVNGAYEINVYEDSVEIANNESGVGITISYDDNDKKLHITNGSDAEIAMDENSVELIATNQDGEKSYAWLTGNDFEISLQDDSKVFNFDQYGCGLSLPTTDPQRRGYLWNDNGTVKVSAGGN